jgi:methanogenic corrinoid protein MtbC1
MIAQRCTGLAAACVVVASFAAGCSSSSATSAPASTSASAKASASASAKTAVCQSAADLKTSVTGLKDTNITANGLSAIQDQLTKIEQQFQKFMADAKGQFKPQTDAMSSALSTLTSSLDAAKSNPNAGTLATVASSALSVVTAGKNLVTAVTNTC